MRFEQMPHTDAVFLTYPQGQTTPLYWAGCNVCAQLQEVTLRDASDWPGMCEPCLEDMRDAERCGDCELDNAWDYAEAMEVATESYYRA